MEDTSATRRNRSLRGWPVLARIAFAILIVTFAILSEGCSQYMGTTSASFLRKVKEADDPNVRYLAYAKLANPNCYESPDQKAEAVRILVESLEKRNEPVASRAVILQTLGTLRDSRARDVVLKATNDPEPIIRVQACRALGKVGSTEDATVLARVMATDTLEDCRIAAIEALGELKPNDSRIYAVLVSGMQHDDPATRLASLDALRAISGKDYGVEAMAWQTNFLKEPSRSPEKSGQTLMASQVPATGKKEVKTVPVATMSYPPRLVPRTVTDPDAQAASFLPVPAPAQPGDAPATPNYPAHNPNLPPNPGGR